MTGAINLLGLSRDELRELVRSWDLSEVHAARLWRYLYLENIGNLSRMEELPKRLRDRLETETFLKKPIVQTDWRSSDGFTRKHLLRLSDGEKIEAVLMRYTGRVTACLSSQVGCAMGCVFCATGQMGFRRHLTTAEIVAEALHIDRLLREGGGDGSLSQPKSASPHARHERLRNVVFMGMGEPLHNYDAVMKAVDILRDGGGLSIGARKISISTVGVVPGIVRMADERRPVHLAVSLHGATQEARAELVPAAKAWPLAELMEACRYYAEKLERRIFFEWTLVDGQNDTEDQARALGSLLRGMPAQVNLIPLNPTKGFSGEAGGRDAARKFQSVLAEFNLPSTIRQRRGIDIAAGCGQLANG